jgi:dihydroflavonol-4-reductase
MTTLVTGATGLVGNNVIRVLLAQQRPVRVLLRPDSDQRPFEGLDVERVEGDITDAASVHRAVKGADGAIHCAGLVHIGWSFQELHDHVNLGGVVHVGDACLAEKIPMVHVSTVNALGIGAWDKPANETTALPGITQCPYVISKRSADHRIVDLAAKGLTSTIVYPGFMLGPWDWKPSSGKMLLEVASRWTPFAPIGGFSICDVRNVAAAILKAYDRMSDPTTRETGKPSHYIMAGENLTYLDAWRLFAKVADGRAPVGRCGPLMRIVAGRFGDLLGKCTGKEPNVNSAAIQMSSLPHYFSSDLATRELDYCAGNVELAATAAWDWFQEHGYVK